MVEHTQNTLTKFIKRFFFASENRHANSRTFIFNISSNVLKNRVHEIFSKVYYNAFFDTDIRLIFYDSILKNLLDKNVYFSENETF